MINRTLFFNGVRARFGALAQSQVDGFNAVMAEWERRRLTDLRWLAYILATTWWETARTMQPIREYGLGKGRAYGVSDPVTGQAYYGRGYVQLTWKANYSTLGMRLGVDLVHKPDLALDDRIAAQIMFEGMIDGLFTGKKLSTYFDGARIDWVGARRIINGTDKAQTIAGLARDVYAVLLVAQQPAAAPPSPPPPLKPGGGSSGGAGASGGWTQKRPKPPVAPPSPPVIDAQPAPAPAPQGFVARFLAALTRRAAR